MHKCWKRGEEFNGAIRPKNGSGSREETLAKKQEHPTPKNGLPMKHASSAITTLYRVLMYLPESLFILFIILTFAFFAAPITKISPAGVLLGELNVGNIYKIVTIYGVEGLRGPAIAAITFSILGVPYAIMLAFRLAFRDYKDFKKTPFLTYAFYLIFFVLGSVMIANTAAIDNGRGLLSAGACPILLIVFPVIFAAFNAFALVACKKLKNHRKVIMDTEAKKEARAERFKAFYATNPVPVPPERNYFSKKARKWLETCYKHKQVNYNKGKSGYSSTLVWLEVHKIALGITALVLFFAVVLISVLVPYFTNHFRTGYLKKIDLGAEKTNVLQILGKPYGGDTSSNVWFYYESGLAAYAEKAQDIIEQKTRAELQDDLLKAEQLEKDYNALSKQTGSKAFKCIQITFSGERVNSVLLDTRYAFEPYAKKAKSSKLLNNVLFGFYKDETASSSKIKPLMETVKNIPYEVQYTDGSFYRAYVSGGDLAIGNANTYSWTDQYGNYSYDISNEETACIGAVDESGEWTADSGAIATLGLSSVVVPESASSIGDCAFSGCSSLTSILLPKSIKSIGDRAFYNCSALTNINLPESVSSIGNEAFTGCTGLKSITVEEGNTKYACQDGILYNKAKTEFLHIPQAIEGSVTIPEGISSIGDEAFYGRRNLISVAIPESVTSIGRRAFMNCSRLETLTIGSGVNLIKDAAFDGCVKMKSITVSEANSEYACRDGILYNKAKTEFLHIPQAIEGSVTIPEGVLAIGNETFKNCTSLEEITIGNSVASIGYSAFRGCSSLLSVEIGSGVTAIRDAAFEDCEKLKSITVDEENAKYASQDGILYNKEKTEFIHIPQAIKGSVTIPDGIASISDHAFSGCYGLTSITIPNSVTSIGGSAFEDCSGLKTVYYKGTAEGWSRIEIDASRNSSLTSATRYYFTEDAPTAEEWAEWDNWWHYDPETGEPTPWVKEEQ